MDGSVSSQYVSGLLFALSTFSQNSFLRVTGERVSAKYVDMTIKTLADYGVEIKSEENGFFVRGGQTFKEREYVVEGDWSGAAFPLTLGAIGGAVSLENLNVNTLQGDAYILKALALFGAETLVNEGSVCVKSQTLHACEIDCKDIPDLVQILSVAAAYAKGESVFTNVSRLRYKESDRLQGILDMLCSAGIAARVEGDALIICGGEPQGAAFMPQADHRSVMSCAVLAACAKGESTIANAQAVGKSYPKFFQDLKVLGGRENVRIHR